MSIGYISRLYAKLTKKRRAFTAFVIEECANYDKANGACFSHKPCHVLNGWGCSYFEVCVLGPLDDEKFRLPAYDYQKRFAHYEQSRKRRKMFYRINKKGVISHK